MESSFRSIDHAFRLLIMNGAKICKLADATEYYNFAEPHASGMRLICIFLAASLAMDVSIHWRNVKVLKCHSAAEFCPIWLHISPVSRQTTIHFAPVVESILLPCLEDSLEMFKASQRSKTGDRRPGGTAGYAVASLLPPCCQRGPLGIGNVTSYWSKTLPIFCHTRAFF